MGFFDRFFSQPGWKHADADTRLAAVQELAEDEQDLLTTLAREDPDARVRRVATSKLGSVAVLAEVLRGDADAGVREDAARVLQAVAVGEFEADEAASTAAVDALAALPEADAQKAWGTAAKTARHRAAQQTALNRVTDVRVLGSVARRAVEASIRLAALARIDDAAELAAVAMRSEQKDSALAAVERVTDREALRAIAERAKNRAAGRRARALLRELEPEAAAAQESAEDEAADRAPATPAREDLCREAESLTKLPGDRAAARVAELRAAWDAAAAGEDAELAARFGAACEAVEQERARREAERERRREELTRQIAAREAICSVIEAIDGEDARQTLEEAHAAWQQLDPLVEGDDPAARAVVARFQAVSAGCERRSEALIARRQQQARLEGVCREAEALAEAADPIEARSRWGALRRAWSEATAGTEIDAALAARFAEADARAEAREKQAREKQARQQRDNLARLMQLANRIDGLLKAENLTLKEVEHALRDARAMADNPGPLPSKRDQEQVVERLKALHDALLPRVQELREIDEWQRWANASMQEELCRRVEALCTLDDLEEAARLLREAQAEWKTVAAAPREKAQALWFRFRSAVDQVRARCDVYFAQQAEERAGNLARKEALCQQAEALKDSTDWIRTAEELKRLQAEWKTIGPVPRGHEKAIWERFRGACNHFFTRRHEDLVHRKEMWAGNQARKEALIGRVDALAESPADWDAAAAEVRRLQVEWKAIGPVRRNRSEVLWQRFRTACEQFFERYQQRDQVKVTSSIAEREALVTELAGLLPSEEGAGTTTPPEGLIARVQMIRHHWQQAASLPREQFAPLHDRFRGTLIRLAQTWPAAFRGTDLDLQQNRRRLEELCSRVESRLSGDTRQVPVGASPVAILASQLREALAANTIGGRAAVMDDEARWRAAVEDVRDAQAAWRRVGPVPIDVAQALTARFQRACNRFFAQRERHRPPAPTGKITATGHE